MITREKRQRFVAQCAIALTTLLCTQSLLSQAGAKEVPSTRLAELSRSIEDLSDRVSPAVVQVFASGFRVNPEGGTSDPGLISKTRNVGSGVVMDSEGHVLTNAHVIEGRPRLRSHCQRCLRRVLLASRFSKGVARGFLPRLLVSILTRTWLC